MHVATAIPAATVVVPALHVHVHIHIRIHHRFHGPPFDYWALAAGAAASWIGLPGPGEPLLIAAGILAAKHKLDIVSVLLVAFAAAWGGGMFGWLVGLKAGRRVLSAPGPLHRLRLRALRRGDEVFERFVALAVLVAPSVVAGIYRVRWTVYVFLNTVYALAWSVGIGLGAYFAGPPIVDAVSDLGWATAAGLALLVAAGIALEVRRRRHRREREQTRAA